MYSRNHNHRTSRKGLPVVLLFLWVVALWRTTVSAAAAAAEEDAETTRAADPWSWQFGGGDHAKEGHPQQLRGLTQEEQPTMGSVTAAPATTATTGSRSHTDDEDEDEDWQYTKPRLQEELRDLRAIFDIFGDQDRQVGVGVSTNPNGEDFNKEEDKDEDEEAGEEDEEDEEEDSSLFLEDTSAETAAPALQVLKEYSCEASTSTSIQSGTGATATSTTITTTWITYLETTLSLDLEYHLDETSSSLDRFEQLLPNAVVAAYNRWMFQACDVPYFRRILNATLIVTSTSATESEAGNRSSPAAAAAANGIFSSSSAVAANRNDAFSNRPWPPGIHANDEPSPSPSSNPLLLLQDSRSHSILVDIFAECRNCSGMMGDTTEDQDEDDWPLFSHTQDEEEEDAFLGDSSSSSFAQSRQEAASASGNDWELVVMDYTDPIVAQNVSTYLEDATQAFTESMVQTSPMDGSTMCLCPLPTKKNDQESNTNTLVRAPTKQEFLLALNEELALMTISYLQQQQEGDADGDDVTIDVLTNTTATTEPDDAGTNNDASETIPMANVTNLEEVQTLACGAEEQPFTALVGVDFVLAANGTATSTNTTTTSNTTATNGTTTMARMTPAERLALQQAFVETYNALSYQNCDGQFRTLNLVALEILDEDEDEDEFDDGNTTTTTSNSTMAPSTTTTTASPAISTTAPETASILRRYQRPGHHPRRSLQNNQTSNTNSSADRHDESISAATFEVTGSCRQCSTGGDFALFDDAFRRRRRTKESGRPSKALSSPPPLRFLQSGFPTTTPTGSSSFTNITTNSTADNNSTTAAPMGGTCICPVDAEPNGSIPKDLFLEHYNEQIIKLQNAGIVQANVIAVENLVQEGRHQIVPCGDTVQEFTTLAVLDFDLVWAAKEQDSIKTTAPSTSAPTTTSQRNGAIVITEQEQAMLERVLVRAYNQVAFLVCDDQFRTLTSAQLVLQNDDEPGSRNPRGYSQRYLQRQQQQQAGNDTHFVFGNATSSSNDTNTTEPLSEEQQQQQQDAEREARITPSTVFSVTGSCRNCPVVDTGSFDLFDDSFRRRVLSELELSSSFSTAGTFGKRRRNLQQLYATNTNMTVVDEYAFLDSNSSETNLNDRCVCPANFEPEQRSITKLDFLQVLNKEIADLQNEEGALTAIQDTSDVEIAEEVPCGAGVREFTSYVYVDLALNSSKGIPESERLALENTFAESYNQLSWLVCDEYHRNIVSAKLDVAKPSAARLNRRLQGGARENSTDFVSSGSVFEVTGECRYVPFVCDPLSCQMLVYECFSAIGFVVLSICHSQGNAAFMCWRRANRECPVTETGSHALFDDSFRRRLSKDVRRKYIRLRNNAPARRMRELQASPNTTASACVCPAGSSSKPDRDRVVPKIDFLDVYNIEIQELRQQGVVSVVDIVSELEEGQEVACGSPEKSFTTTVSSSLLVDQSAITKDEIQAVETAFRDAYNLLGETACDGYFRSVLNVDLGLPPASAGVFPFGGRRLDATSSETWGNTTSASAGPAMSASIFTVTGSCRYVIGDAVRFHY